MNKRNLLRACDITLVVVSVLILASSIQMEASAGMPWHGIPFVVYMTIHVLLACLMMGLVVYHLYLHFGWKAWVNKIKNLPKKPTKWLSVVAAMTLLTGVAALVVLLINMHHTSLGGVHGKIGLLMLAIVIGHTIKRAKFLKK